MQVRNIHTSMLTVFGLLFLLHGHISSLGTFVFLFLFSLSNPAWITMLCLKFEINNQLYDSFLQDFISFLVDCVVDKRCTPAVFPVIFCFLTCWLTVDLNG